MTTFTEITNAQVDQDSPITQTLITALRDNPLALNELATGAPKPYWKLVTAGGSSYANPLDLTGIGDFQGLHATGNTDPSSTSASFALSTDNGSTFSAASSFTINSVLADFEFYVDLTTGSTYFASYNAGGGIQTATLAGASSSVNAIRIDLNSGTVTSQGIFIRLIGKEVV